MPLCDLTPANDKPSEATVPLQTAFPSSLLLPYDNTAGYVMGMALVNLGLSAANVNAGPFGTKAARSLARSRFRFQERPHRFRRCRTNYP